MTPLLQTWRSAAQVADQRIKNGAKVKMLKRKIQISAEGRRQRYHWSLKFRSNWIKTCASTQKAGIADNPGAYACDLWKKCAGVAPTLPPPPLLAAAIEARFDNNLTHPMQINSFLRPIIIDLAGPTQLEMQAIAEALSPIPLNYRQQWHKARKTLQAVGVYQGRGVFSRLAMDWHQYFGELPPKQIPDFLAAGWREHKDKPEHQLQLILIGMIRAIKQEVA